MACRGDPGASCLPLASLTSPLLALRTATPDESAFGPEGRAVPAFDAWLDRAAARRPVVLAVDDVHWADERSPHAAIAFLSGGVARRHGGLTELFVTVYWR
jgi:hypothetical protein